VPEYHHTVCRQILIKFGFNFFELNFWTKKFIWVCPRVLFLPKWGWL